MASHLEGYPSVRVTLRLAGLPEVNGAAAAPIAFRPGL
jgi:hypothetical protein